MNMKAGQVAKLRNLKPPPQVGEKKLGELRPGELVHLWEWCGSCREDFWHQKTWILNKEHVSYMNYVVGAIRVLCPCPVWLSRAPLSIILRLAFIRGCN